MLLKIQLILLSLTLKASLHTSSPIVIKLNTDQIINALTSKGSLKYIDKLAKIFATKAAKHFIDQIRNEEREIDRNKEYDKLEKVKKFQDRSEKKVLDETEALVLLDEPPPDGDNLSIMSDELSVTEDEVKVKKAIPVIGLTKVNGKYFYRRYYMI